MATVWLIHNNIPPYRVPLFAEIAKTANFDFCIVLTAAKSKHRPRWKMKAEAMPFKVLTTKGLNFVWSEDASVSISLSLFPSLILRRPDVVICSGFSLSTLMVFIYSKLFNKKYVVWSEPTETTERLRRMGRLRRWIRRVLASNADAFIDAGRLSREYIWSLLPVNSKVPFFRSYNCVDGSAFSSQLGDISDGSRTTVPVCRKILFVGRINANKGVPMLLHAYADLSTGSNFPVDLVLVGEGPLEQYVREFKCKNGLAGIHLEGQVSYVEVARYYETCTVFILLSLRDCNPLTVFEALHAGIPIVCTDRAGNSSDFIVHGKNGYIVDPEDRDSIVRYLSDILKWDAAKRAACKQVSRELVKKANYEDSAAAFIQASESILHE